MSSLVHQKTRNNTCHNHGNDNKNDDNRCDSLTSLRSHKIIPLLSIYCSFGITASKKPSRKTTLSEYCNSFSSLIQGISYYFSVKCNLPLSRNVPEPLLSGDGGPHNQKGRRKCHGRLLRKPSASAYQFQTFRCDSGGHISGK